jgi:membrane protein
VRDRPAAENTPNPLPPPTPSVLQRLALALGRLRAQRERIELARVHSGPLDAALETVERDSQIGGGILAGALAYRVFVFALPLAFFLVSGLGVLARVLGVDPQAAGSDVGLAGLVTKQVASAANGSSSFWVALTSFLLLAYVTRVLLRAVAIVHALAWERSAAAVKVSPRALGVFAAAIVVQLTLVGGVGALREQSPAGGVAVLPVFVLGVAGLWLAVSLHLSHSAARWSDLVPGALLYGAGILGVQVFSVYALGRLLESKASTYGTLGGAAAVLLAFFFVGRVIVGAAVLNATLYERRSRSRQAEA